MDIIRLQGTEKKLFELVGPLVMSPAVLRQNNNYPFKTGLKYTWHIAVDHDEVAGFIPVKSTAPDSYLIDNYYIKGDDSQILCALLEDIIEHKAAQAELWATVHKRHVDLFSQNGFHCHVNWKKYDKMQYFPK